MCEDNSRQGRRKIQLLTAASCMMVVGMKIDGVFYAAPIASIYMEDLLYASQWRAM